MGTLGKGMARAVGAAARRRTTAEPDATATPVVEARRVPELTKMTLVARSAGCCEFRGCKKFLFEHSLTKDGGNFGEAAHIVAFRQAGPRGSEARPASINSIENLMLLCAECHHNIDTHPERYSRVELLEQKREFEDRIRMLCGLGPELRTNILALKSRIGERVVEIAIDEAATALRPRYPASSAFRTIDLTQLGDEVGDNYYPLAVRRIREHARELYAQDGPLAQVKHLSVFALAPIPLLVALGGALSNTVPTDFFQSHRDKPDRWAWYSEGEPVRYSAERLRTGTRPECVALILSLSGSIAEASLPAEINGDYSVYVLTLAGASPNPGFLRQRLDLESFRLAYRQVLAEVTRDHAGLNVLHLFPAVPAPIGLVLGFDLLPKAHPALAVYDFDKRVGGFIERVRINHHE